MVGAVLAGAVRAFGDGGETVTAREMMKLGQVSLLKAAAERAKGTPVGAMYQSQVTMAEFDQAVDKVAAGDAYAANLSAYLSSGPRDLDGIWVAEQGKFMVSALAQPVASRIELWGPTGGEGGGWGGLAGLADRTLQLAHARLKPAMAAVEAVKPFEEAAFSPLLAADTEAGYDRAFALYFRAIAMDAEDRTLGAARGDLLRQAMTLLNEWADGDEQNGVKPQSLLLRAKAQIELGQWDGAIRDLKGALEHAGSADWIRYQVRVQTIAAYLGKGDLRAAQEAYFEFSNYVAGLNGPADAKVMALAGLDVMHFRVAAAQAEALMPAQKTQGRVAAVHILSNLIQRDGRFRELVFEHLAALAGSAPALQELPPLQRLAVAWERAQRKGPEERIAWQGGIEAARMVMEDGDAGEKAEAMLVAGVCYTRLGRQAEAASLNLQFAEAMPADVRAKQAVEVALGQIGELRKAGALSAENQALADHALALATGRFGQKQWLYARGVLLQEEGKRDEATSILSQIGPDDETYLDARYRLVVLAMGRMSEVGPGETKNAAARDLVEGCGQLIAMLKNAPAAVRDARKAYIVDIRLVQAAALISPLGNADAALDALDSLDAEAGAMKLTVSAAARAAVLRDRILAWQMAGRPDKAMVELDRLRIDSPEKAVDIAQGMLSQNVEQVARLETQDAEKAKALAAASVALVDRLIKDIPAGAYKYRQIKADLLTRAGRPADAAVLWHDLQADGVAQVKAGKRPEDDLLNYIGEARALQAAEKYADARKRLNELLGRVEPGSEAYWEVYLRILQCLEKEGADKDVIARPLRDLRAAYGAGFGGKGFKGAFEGMERKYQ